MITRVTSLLALLSIVSVCAVAAQERTRADTATPMAPIVVTVTRTAETTSRVPFAIGVLWGDDIIRAGPGTSLSAALAAIPGVLSQNRFNAARDESLSIRGFGARAAFGIRGVRVLLDGIPQTLPDGQGQLTNIDLRRVTRIEVLRGAASALYGNAAGGVVSLWTDRTVPTSVAPDLRVFGGSDGLFAIDAGVTAPIGEGSVIVTGSRTRSDGFRDQTRYEAWRGSFRASYPVSDATRVITTAHLTHLPVAEDPGALTAEEVADDYRQANPRNLAVDAGKDVFQGQGGITVEHLLQNGGQLQATVFGLRRDLMNVLPFATIDLERSAYGARAVSTLPIPAAFAPELTVGADLQWQRDDRQNRSPDGTTITRDQFETVRELGPFLQLRAQPHHRVSLTLGGRYDAVQFRAADRLLSDGDDSGERTMTALSGTVGAAVDIDVAFAPYANLGTAFETPTTTELANRPDGADGFNPDLEPQRATHYELGARGRVAWVSYTLAVYQADVRDGLIPFEVPSVPGRTFFRNAGKSRHRGVEASASVTPVPGLRLSSAYTYSHLRFIDFATEDATFDGNSMPGVPTHFLSGALAIRHGLFQADLESRASSSFYLNDANTVENDAWWVTDLRAGLTVTLAGWRMSPYAGSENLFDQRYVAAVAANAGFGRFFEPASGRAFYFGVEASR